MPWQAGLNADLRIVECGYSGCLTRAELRASAAAVAALCREHGVARLLADCRSLDPGGHALVDLYDLAGTLDAAGVSRDLREALLLPGPVDDRASFWADACFNRGFRQVRCFPDREAALTWLLQGRGDVP